MCFAEWVGWVEELVVAGMGRTRAGPAQPWELAEVVEKDIVVQEVKLS